MIVLIVCPILGLLVSLAFYVYLGRVIRKVVNPVSHENITLYKDFTPYTQNNALDNLHYGPEYIEKITLNNETAIISPTNFYS